MALGLLILNPRIQWTFPPSPRLLRLPQASSEGKDCVKLGFWMVEAKAFTPRLLPGKGLGLTHHPTLLSRLLPFLPRKRVSG